MRNFLTVLCVMALGGAAFAAPEQGRNPALGRFAEIIALYASLDGYPVADLSLGNGEPLQGDVEWAEKHFEPGLWGKALRSDAPAIEYDTLRHAALEKSGAVAFWVRPLEWDTSREPTYIGFLRIEAGREGKGRQLQVLRMGSKVNKHALAAHFVSGKPATTIRLGSAGNWDKPRWHLFVVNWTPGYLEASLNGRALVRHAFHSGQPPGGGPPASFIKLPGGGDTQGFPYLIDEVLFFTRPLNSEEVRWLYQSVPNP